MSDVTKILDENSNGGKTKKKSNEEKRSETMKKLGELQNQFDNETRAETQKLDLKRMEYEAPDDDELMAEARRSLGEKYDKARSDAQNTATKRKSTVEELIRSASENAEKEKEKLDQNYAAAKSDVENSALKRGIARSSIAHNSIAALAESLADKKSELDRATGEKKESLEREIAQAESELEKALKNIDDEENSAAADAFKKLKKESDDKAEEVLKYNNTLEEKEKNFAQKTYDIKTQEELDKIKKEYDTKKLAVALDYYASIEDGVSALNEFLGDEVMKDYLGDYYDYALALLRSRIK